MGKPRKQRVKKPKGRPHHATPGRDAKGELAEHDKAQVAGFAARHPILRFVLVFAVCMGLFYALTITSFFETRGWGPYLDLNAEVSGAILGLFIDDVTVSGRSISSPQASILIERGCDAIHPTGLFLSAVIAAPTSVLSKVFGMFTGTFLLMSLNLVRIITLFVIRIHWPDMFEIMHVEVWQALFIFLALLLWVLWANWAVRGKVHEPDVST